MIKNLTVGSFDWVINFINMRGSVLMFSLNSGQVLHGPPAARRNSSKVILAIMHCGDVAECQDAYDNVQYKRSTTSCRII